MREAPRPEPEEAGSAEVAAPLGTLPRGDESPSAASPGAESPSAEPLSAEPLTAESPSAESPSAEPSSDSGFVDESPSAEPSSDLGFVDEREVEPDEVQDLGDEEAEFLDVAAGADPDPVVVKAVPLPGPQPVPRKIRLPPKETAVVAPHKPITVPATGELPGYAECPACEARNPAAALTCARCSEAIPPPGPTRAPRQSLLAGRARRGLELEIDAELIPEHVRAGFAESRREQEERSAAWVLRRLQSRKHLMVATGAVFALGSLLSAPLVGLLAIPWFAADVAAGALVGRHVFETQWDQLRCAVLGASVAGGTTLAKMICSVAWTGDVRVAGALFPVLLLFLSFGAGICYFARTHLDMLEGDQQL